MIGLKTVGRPPIKYAGSVKEVVNLRGDYAPAIMNRGEALSDELVGALLNQSVMTWTGRNPAPALDQNGNFQGTDLDLFSFLVPLVDRKAIIEIPHYRNRRKIVRRDGERKVGSSQFGTITGLTSNKEVLSFSARLFDMSVARENALGVETLGAHRNYMLVDCDDDTVLVKVKRLGDGNVCHTGERTCFFRRMSETTEDTDNEHRTRQV